MLQYKYYLDIWYYHSCLDVARCASRTIRFQDSLTSNISGKNQLIFSFVMCEVSHQGKITSGTNTFGWVLPGKPYVQSVCRILLWSISLEKINILVCLQGVSHQWNVAYETTNFGWMWPVVLLVQSDYRIFWSAMSLEITNWCLWFFAWR